MFSLAAATAILSLLASSYAAPQGSSTGVVHKVTVGAGGQLAFAPDSISANVGDTVLFEFHQKNHSATQSSLAAPCSPLANGFNTGFVPVAASVTSGFPTKTYVVQDTKPFWIYCAQDDGAHCHAGMVFAVNCGPTGANNSFAAFKADAIALGSATATAGASYGTPDTTSYPGITVPPLPIPTLVTVPVTLESSTWTTTYSSYPNSPNPTPASLEGNVILVTVGANGQLAYDPPHVSAQPRDTIVFQFHQKNHSASQSSFSDPCRKLQFTSTTGQVGFDSGFMPVPANATVFPTFNITVNDTAPIWVYCRQANHCGSGMVFAINTDESGPDNFAAFQSLAEQINGTGTTTNSSSAGSTTPAPASSGALKLSASLFVSLLGAAAALLL